MSTGQQCQICEGQMCAVEVRVYKFSFVFQPILFQNTTALPHFQLPYFQCPLCVICVICYLILWCWIGFAVVSNISASTIVTTDCHKPENDTSCTTATFTPLPYGSWSSTTPLIVLLDETLDRHLLRMMQRRMSWSWAWQFHHCAFKIND